jgi:hypothetical protein
MIQFVIFGLLLSITLAQDPADSWLTYAKAAGDGSRILSFYAETT